MERAYETQPIILVAEPQALPGMWLEDVLIDAGCTVSGPFGTCEEAAGSLDRTRPDFAIVSIDLNRGLGFPLACALRRKGIPFALITGNARVPRAFSDMPLFDRLFDARAMVSAVTAGCRAPHRLQACPMGPCLTAGIPFALDQCPTGCRA